MLKIKQEKQRNGRLLPLARDLAAFAKPTKVTEASVDLLSANVKNKYRQSERKGRRE